MPLTRIDTSAQPMILTQEGIQTMNPALNFLAGKLFLKCLYEYDLVTRQMKLAILFEMFLHHDKCAKLS